MTARSQMEATGRRVASSGLFRVLSSAGLAARGVIYLIVGVLAIEIATGRTGQEADRQGALRTVARTPFGTVLLWLLVVGFAGLTLLWLSEAVYGQPYRGGDTAAMRLASLARGIFYGVICAGTVGFIAGSGRQGSGDQKSQDLTATVMHDVPAGRWLVLLVGLGFVAGGTGVAVRGLQTRFEQPLDTHEMSRPVRLVIRALGVVGQAARAVVCVVAGVFLGYAAITYDPTKAKGLDGTLREFARTSAGPFLLLLVASGLIVFGVYSVCEARWRRV
jgi:Domain of Unknown Function (DUF1206)